MNTIKIIFLGTNGWYDNQTGNTVSLLIQHNDFSIVLDAGNGIYKLDSYSDMSKPHYLFISHFHIDHIAGLHILPKFNFIYPLNIIGPSDSRKHLTNLLAQPYTIPMQDYSYSVNILEYGKITGLFPFSFTLLPMKHTTETLGVRLEIGAKIITYCPDTGYCPNAVELAKNADILITECAYRHLQENSAWPHLNPETAGRIAVEANAKKLILTHFDAENYSDEIKRRQGAEYSRAVFSNSFAAFDGMEVIL